MGFNAYHKVIKYIRPDDEKHGELVMKGSMTTCVENSFYVSSAYEMYEEIKSPLDLIQETVAHNLVHAEDGRSFTLETEELKDLIKTIEHKFPGHPDTQDAVDIIEGILGREDSDYHDFVCY